MAASLVFLDTLKTYHCTKKGIEGGMYASCRVLNDCQNCFFKSRELHIIVDFYFYFIFLSNNRLCLSVGEQGTTLSQLLKIVET